MNHLLEHNVIKSNSHFRSGFWKLPWPSTCWKEDLDHRYSQNFVTLIMCFKWSFAANSFIVLRPRRKTTKYWYIALLYSGFKDIAASVTIWHRYITWNFGVMSKARDNTDSVWHCALISHDLLILSFYPLKICDVKSKHFYLSRTKKI